MPSARAVALAAAVATATAGWALTARPPGGRSRWSRTNYRDRQVDLLGGPAAAAGALATALPLLAVGEPGPLIVGVGAGALGLYDDLVGETHARGLRGHLRELRTGRFTTGLAKLVGLVATGYVAASTRRTATPRHPLSAVVDAALVSGTANLVNLLDLRPGRALKAVVIVAVPLAVADGDGGAVAAGVLGTACCLLPADLGERRMVGDCGANTLGALLGWAVARRGGVGGRALALTAVVGLTLASERISFSAVIDRSAVLRRLDLLGRAR